MIVAEVVDGKCALAFNLPCMSKTQFRLSVVAIFAAILLYNLTSPNRYTHTHSGVTTFVTDGVTGKAWYGGPGKEWSEIGK